MYNIRQAKTFFKCENNQKCLPYPCSLIAFGWGGSYKNHLNSVKVFTS